MQYTLPDQSQSASAILDSPFSFPTEAFPWVPGLSEVKNLQQLLAFIQQKRAKENAHIMELKKYHLQLQQVCVCVSIWLHVYV